jgi:hypothetical protein
MKCPRCGYNYCDMISEKTTSGKDYSICRGLLGEALCGTFGYICGFSDSRNSNVEAYWVCKKCKNKFKA